MSANKKITIFQVIILIICVIGAFQYSISNNQSEIIQDSFIEVIDSNGIKHNFDSKPQRVAIANTFTASAMRMIDVDPSVIVGVSGDFYDEELWPEFSETPIVQQSAHSEIDFEALFDSRPEIYLVFATNGNNEVLRLTAGGLMGLGTNSPSSYIGGGENFVIAESGDAGMTIATGTSSTGTINFADGTSGDARYRGRIEYSHSIDALDILTAATTRVRIDSIGRLLVNTTSPSNGASFGNITLEFAGNSYNGIKTRDTDNTGTVTHLVFVSGSSAVGSITGDTGQAYYNNLSDYRRKENDVEIADGIQKLKLLRPIRFNYISDPNTVCDGFFAHEVTPAVPTAVTGAKDAVDSEGEIDPQMLDASKLVPLLTAALQEAIAKIETLETKVAALENP